MTTRTITADEARDLLDGTTPGPWAVGTHQEQAVGIAAVSLHPDAADAEWPLLCTDTTGAVVVVDVDDLRLMAAAPDLAATVIALHARIAEARDLAHRLAVSKGIAGTKGEAALLDVRDLLAAALRDARDQKEAP